jgi:hypothetical protein
MNVIPLTPRSVATYIEIFDEAILWGQMRGLAGDWNRLHRRLDALSQRVREREANGASTRAPDWAHRLEHKLLIDALHEMLLPEALDDLIQALRSQRERGEADLGVWAPLDREAMERSRKREWSAEAAAFAALKHHAKKPRHAHIIDGLRALEDLHDVRVRLNPLFDAELLVNEGRHFANAIGTLLPPTARRLLSIEVEARFRSRLEGKSIDQLNPAEAYWHHHLVGLGVWQPVWSRLRSGADHPDPLINRFVSSVQEIYEEAHSEAKADRAKKSKAEQRRRRAAAAKQERQSRKDAERRAEVARLREHEELQRKEEERKRQAEAEEAQERISRERQEQERKWWAESQAQQEKIRKIRLEEIRNRPPPPPPRLVWKRRPEEIRRRWAESEFEKWRQRRGLSREEVPASVREAFIRDRS